MRRIRSVFVVLLTTLGLVAVASPARADFSECWTTYACVFSGANGTGTLLFASDAPPGSCVNLPGSANDLAMSYINRLGNRHFQIYRNAGCSGHALHKNNGFGGATQPFPPAGDNRLGNFINIDNQAIPGCGQPDHCDNRVATSFYFNNG